MTGTRVLVDGTGRGLVACLVPNGRADRGGRGQLRHRFCAGGIGHDVGRFEEFRRRYHAEFDENPEVEALLTLITATPGTSTTLAPLSSATPSSNRTALCNATHGRRN